MTMYQPGDLLPGQVAHEPVEVSMSQSVRAGELDLEVGEDLLELRDDEDHDRAEDQTAIRTTTIG